jgi:hypothetical protein
LRVFIHNSLQRVVLFILLSRELFVKRLELLIITTLMGRYEIARQTFGSRAWFRQ